MSDLRPPPDDMPMQNTPPPPLNLAGQVTWLSERLSVLIEVNVRLQEEVDTLRARMEEVDTLRARVEELELHGGQTRAQEPKVADPPMFKGDQKELEGWITACRLKFAGQPSRFPKESAKVIFAASHLAGPPKSWIQPMVAAFLSKGPEPKPEEFNSFETFIASLKALYGDPNLARNALLEIEHLRQTTSVADYISRFAGLSQHTGLTDDGLVRYFYKGLKDGIKDELTTQEYGTLKELQNLSTWLDTRQHERAIERMIERNRGTTAKVNSSTSVAHPPRPKSFAPAPATPRSYPVSSNPTWRTASTPMTTLVPDGSTPMSWIARGRRGSRRTRRTGDPVSGNAGTVGLRAIDKPIAHD